MYLIRNVTNKSGYKIKIGIGIFSFFILWFISKDLVLTVIQTFILLLFLSIADLLRKIKDDKVFYRYLFLLIFLSVLLFNILNIIIFNVYLLIFHLKKSE